MRSELPRILAVADVNRAAAVDRREALLSLYCDVLRLIPVEVGNGVLALRGQQVTGPKLLIRLLDAAPEPDPHPVPIQVACLTEAAEVLGERGIEVLTSQGMWFYDRRLLLQDPAGNWICLTTSHPL